MNRFKIYFIIIIIIIVLNNCIFSDIKIDYLFIQKNKEIEKVINAIIKSIKEKNKKDFIDLFSNEFRTAHNSSLMLKLKKDDLNKYLNTKPNMDDPVSIFFGLLFDNDFANKEYMRSSYSKLEFNLTVYNLPYKTQAENPPAFYIMIFWDKIDLASINFALNDKFQIIQMFSFHDYSSIYSKNPKKKYNSYLGDNITIYKDRNLKDEFKIINRNTEIKYIKTYSDNLIKIKFRGEDFQTYVDEIRIVNEKDTPLFILGCYKIYVEDFFDNLKNWKNWIGKEDFY